jgi:hypothetical protein
MSRLLIRWILLAAIAVGTGLVPSAARAQILNTLRGFSPDPGWSGDVQALVSLSGGNSEVTILSGGGFVQWQDDPHRVRLLLAGRRVTDNGDELAESALGHLRHNRRLTGPLHSIVFVQQQTNPFQRLRSRTLFGAGLRHDVVDAENLRAAVGLTHMTELERIEGLSGTTTSQRASAFITVDGNVNEQVVVDVSAFFQPLWHELANNRAFATATLRVSVGGGLEVRMAADLTHDTAPPDRVEETDWSVSSGVGVTF